MIDIVVSHYNEDVSWLKDLNFDQIRHIFVYTKGNKIDVTSYNSKIIQRYLDNLGREIGTILYHCENEYDNLPEYVAFLQGNPFDNFTYTQVTDMILNSHQSDYSYFVIPGGNDITSYLDSTLHMNKEAFPYYFPMDLCPYNLKEWIYVHLFESNRSEFNQHFKINVPVFWKSIFAINSKCIKHRNPEFYRKLRTTEFMRLNSECGHFLERSYYYLFQLYK